LVEQEAPIVDLLFLSHDDCVNHLEFQATNFRRIPYRQGLYRFLIGDAYPGRIVRQTVIYVGARKMSMPAGVTWATPRVPTG
jgi:hypothetical protein